MGTAGGAVIAFLRSRSFPGCSVESRSGNPVVLFSAPVPPGPNPLAFNSAGSFCHSGERKSHLLHATVKNQSQNSAHWILRTLVH